MYTAVSTLKGYLYVYCGVYIKWLPICYVYCGVRIKWLSFCMHTAVSTLSCYLYVYCGVYIKWLSICTLRCPWHPVTVQKGFKASPWAVHKFPDPPNRMKNCQSWTMGWTSFPVLWAISFYRWKESSQKAWNNPVRFGLTLGVKRLTSTLLRTVQLPLDLVSQGQTRQRPCTKDYK